MKHDGTDEPLSIHAWSRRVATVADFKSDYQVPKSLSHAFEQVA
jgi:hypothetical protein